MNNKGSVAIFGLMLGLTIIILGLALAPAVSQATETARNQTNGDTVGLDCSNSSISDFDKATCIATDLNIFYFIGSIILIGGSLIGIKILSG